MPIKHITFNDVDSEAFRKTQNVWLARSAESPGLRLAWAAESKGGARAVFVWESDQALRAFMEETHDRALAEAGTAGRYAALYLDELDPPLLSIEGATHVAESLAWVKDGGDAEYLESVRVWDAGTRKAEGFVASTIAKGRRAVLSTTFWRDGAAHAKFLREIVPKLRAQTMGDEFVGRLIRFDGPLVPELTHPRIAVPA